MVISLFWLSLSCQNITLHPAFLRNSLSRLILAQKDHFLMRIIYAENAPVPSFLNQKMQEIALYQQNQWYHFASTEEREGVRKGHEKMPNAK